MSALSQITAAEPEQIDWLKLPDAVITTILQHLYDSTSDKHDVLHALLVCKQWAAAAGALSYALDLDCEGHGSLAYDLPGIAWLLRHSKQVTALTVLGDSGAASGTLQALQWDRLKLLVLEAPGTSFAVDVAGGSELEYSIRGHHRAQYIQTPDDTSYLCATHPWDGLPAADKLPCLERLVINNYALLDWRFAVQLRELELTMPRTESEEEQGNGIMWSYMLQELQPLPLLRRFKLDLPLFDAEHLRYCFGTSGKVWSSLLHLEVVVRQQDCAIQDAVLSVLALPSLQSLTFDTWLQVNEFYNEWDALFVEGETWPNLQHLAVTTEETHLPFDARMFPAAELHLTCSQ